MTAPQVGVWCVDPEQTRHLQFLLELPSDLGARAILRRHYECPEHAPTQVRLSSSDRPAATCINCDADLVLLPAEIATPRHVGPGRVGIPG